MTFRKLLAAALCAASLANAASVPSKKPKLVLLVAVDQFRYDYLTRFRADYNSGLARLMERGAAFTNAHYEHYPTVTAIGHSTMLSGATPSISGIVGNEWFDRASGKNVTSVSDPAVTTLGAPERAGASPRRFLVSTVGDELKMAGRAPAKVIGISFKDRSAILPAGHMADAAYWFDSATGNFVSITYYFTDLPDWVMAFNRSRTVDQWAGKEWGPLSGGTPFFKLPAKIDKAYYDKVAGSAYGNELLLAFTEKAIESEKMGQSGGTDLLAVSFSCNDTVGHDVGPFAPEVRDMSIRTDRLLGRLLDFVDKRVGLANVLVVVTADHGVAPVAEELAKRRMPGGRIDVAALHKVIEDALSAEFGEGKWIVGRSGPLPYFDHKLIARKNLKLADVQQAAAQAARMFPHVARVYTREELRHGNAPSDLIGRRISNGFNYQRAADLFIIAEPYYVFEKKGATHGAPYNYDSHVPMIFMGDFIRPGQYHQKVAVNDIAPTLATLLEVEVPSGSSGRVLDEMFGNTK